MKGGFDETIRRTGPGETVTLDNGENVFRLSSFEGNPVVHPRDIGLTSTEEDGNEQLGAVFNGGAVLHGNQAILTPRCHRDYRRITFYDERLGRERTGFDNYVSEVWVLSSDDGVDFAPTGTIIRGDGTEHSDFTYGIEDIRIVPFEDRYLLIGCGKVKPPFKGSNADRVAIYSTEDFESITYHGMIRAFDSRNAVPIFDDNGGAHILLRFHPNIYIARLENGGQELLQPKKYEDWWERVYTHREDHLLLRAGAHAHETEKIGPGPPPIKTDEGWLLIYHAVGEIDGHICRVYGLDRPIERGYSVCAALLDPDEPRRVLYRTNRPLYIPHRPYELYGDDQYPVDIPAVVFPTGAIEHRGRLLLYCGAGDKYMVLLSCETKRLLEYLEDHPAQRE